MSTSPPPQNLHRISVDEAGQRVDRYLKRALPFVPHTLIHKWLRSGQVRLNSARVKADARLAEDDTLRLPPQSMDPQSMGQSVSPSEEARRHKKLHTFDKKTLSLLSRRILMEREDFFLIDKPAGLACQGGRGIAQALDRQLLALAERRPSLGTPRLVHRLDRATSGLLLVAKNRRAAAALANLFQLGRVQKTYSAILIGTPQANKKEHTKKEHTKKNTRTNAQSNASPNTRTNTTPNILTYRSPLADKRKGEQHATTYLFLLAQNEVYDNSLVLLRPVSGRKHQLRRHLAEAGTPIVGEKLYALTKQDSEDSIEETIVVANPPKTRAKRTDGLMLHALRLVIEEEGSRYALDVHLPPPPAFLDACVSSCLDAQKLKDSCFDPFL